MFPLGKGTEETTEYKLISDKFVITEQFDGKEILKIDSKALTLFS